jgi:Chaperone of endosialidase
MADHPFTGTLSVTDKIGIGTENPIAQLHISSSTAAPSQAFLESGGVLLKLSVDASGAKLGTDNAFPLSILTDGSSRIAIDTAGNVGMSGALTVQKTLIVNGSAIVGTDTTPANLTVKGTAIATAFQGQSASFQNNLTVNGKVGIGTTSFPQQLNITGGIGFANQNAVDKKLYSPADGVLEWMTHELAGQHGFAVSHQGDRRVFLNTNGNSHFNGGNVGIGTLTPSQKLEVVGNVLVNGSFRISEGTQAGFGSHFFFSKTDGSPGRGQWHINIAPNNALNFVESGIADYRLAIKPGGNVGIGTNEPQSKLDVKGDIRAGNFFQNSSKELKENIHQLSTQEAVRALAELNPVKFTYKIDRQKNQSIGFIAEDTPGLVATADRKGLSIMNIVGVLTKVLQEQQTTICALTEKLQALEAQVQKS